MKNFPKPILTGLDVCLERPPEALRGARFGLLMNQASISRDFRFACDVLGARFPGQLGALFSPQHGFWGLEQANMIESPHESHGSLGVPIYSLYSETRRPTPEMLADLDCLVIDLQDVGTRVYTFVWTVAYCLEACAKAGVHVVVLDRPNPLGGELVEGRLLDANYTSFVGRWPLPMRHGLTIGELALLLNDQMQLKASMEVVRMEGWRRKMLFPQTGRYWLGPSPNMPRFETALVYSGQVLLEGTNLSEGRGTTTPFEVFGAPWIDPEVLLRELTTFGLPGVRFVPASFNPTFDKWSGQRCGGLFLCVTDRLTFRPYRTTLAILACVRRLWPRDFQWTPPPYEYETEKLPIDILSGSAAVRLAVDEGTLTCAADVARLADLDPAENKTWQGQIQRYRQNDY